MQLAHRADAVAPWHHQVHQDHVGVELGGALERLVAVGRLADDLEALLEREERPQPLAHDRVVVDDQDADRVRPLGCELDPDRGARAGARLDRSAPPELAGALLHRGQAEMARAELGRVGVEPDPVVGDLDHELAVVPRRAGR